jgi:hypothetical protein
MIMPLRYEALHSINSITFKARQPVPRSFADASSGDAYLEYLLGKGNEIQAAFFAELERLVDKFNRASTPGELNLDTEMFPYQIWREASYHSESKTKRLERPPSIGEILYVRRTGEEAGEAEETGRRRASVHSGVATYAYFLDFADDRYLLQLSGEKRPQKLQTDRVKPCRGAAVLVPGPVKSEARAREKLRTDYKDEPHPQAAALLDVVRAAIVLDDPYALAVCVEYIKTEMKVIRLKNRFATDAVETVGVDRLLSEFYAAETSGRPETAGSAEVEGLGSYKQQYRDVNLTVEMSAGETTLLCEIQFTLSPIAILKKSEQKIYSLMRMESPEELREQFVFSRKSEEDESTVMTYQSASSGMDTPGVNQSKASALAAAGLTTDLPEEPISQSPEVAEFNGEETQKSSERAEAGDVDVDLLAMPGSSKWLDDKPESWQPDGTVATSQTEQNFSNGLLGCCSTSCGNPRLRMNL